MAIKAAAFAVAFACLPAAAHAQDPSVNQVLSFLLTTQSVPTADFVRDQQAADATRDTLARALLVELANVPLTTSSGGFAYRFNSSLGTVERVTRGFGPFFVDRAVAGGRRQASISATYRRSEFLTLDSRNLRDGSLVTTSNKFVDEPAPFDIETLNLNIETNTFTVFGTYGLTDELDIGVAVPVVQLRLSGDRTNTYRGASRIQARGQRDYIGIADIPVRVKLQFDRVAQWDLATNLEVRLPTGDPDNLNGSGRYAFTPSVIASRGQGPFEAHLNAGVTIGGASNQLSAAAAVAATVMDRVTFSAEALVRRISRLSRIREVAEPNALFRGVDTIRLLPDDSAATTVAAVAGMRWNIAGTWLLNSYVVIPITSSGLVGRTAPVFSVDYSFNP
jgi:hypothetical protein